MVSVSVKQGWLYIREPYSILRKRSASELNELQLHTDRRQSLISVSKQVSKCSSRAQLTVVTLRRWPYCPNKNVFSDKRTLTVSSIAYLHGGPVPHIRHCWVFQWAICYALQIYEYERRHRIENLDEYHYRRQILIEIWLLILGARALRLQTSEAPNGRARWENISARAGEYLGVLCLVLFLWSVVYWSIVYMYIVLTRLVVCAWGMLKI